MGAPGRGGSPSATRPHGQWVEESDALTYVSTMSPNVSAPASVFDHLDYRAFLRNYYEHGKRRGLSYRSISRRAGIRSSNFFKLVLDGKRNLSETTASAFAKAVNLVDAEYEYFLALVRFNQAKTETERSLARGAMSCFKMHRNVHPLGTACAEYHSNWYLPALRELVATEGFRAEPAWIARTLQPRITESQADRGLQVLFDLGMIVRNDEGRVVQASVSKSLASDLHEVQRLSQHRAMITLAAESLDSWAPAEVALSSLTLAVSRDGLAALKTKLNELRKELLASSQVSPAPTEVVQLNFQLFPLCARSAELTARPATREVVS